MPQCSRRNAHATCSAGVPSPGQCLSASTDPRVDTGIALQVGDRSLEKRWQVWITCSLQHFLLACSMQLSAQRAGFECLSLLCLWHHGVHFIPHLYLDPQEIEDRVGKER